MMSLLKTSVRWVPVLVLALLISGLIGLLSHLRSLPMQSPTPAPVATGPFGSTGDPVKAVRLALGKVELYFERGSTTLRPESRDRLDTIATTLASNPDVHLTLQGHIDNVSPQEKNPGLSGRRAAAVMAELVHRGVPADHLTAEGTSNENTIYDNSSEDERAAHRKVTLEFSEH